MKRVIAFALIILSTAALVLGCAKGYESERTAGDVKVKLKAARYPLIKGDNALSITVTDSAGKAVTNADVNVRYFMPPMPGMAPMDYNAKAELKGDAYTIVANIPMEGGWKVEVTVVQPGKPSATATFNLDAR